MYVLIGDKMSTPDLPPEGNWIVTKWLSEAITGAVALLIGLLLKMQGSKTQVVPVTMEGLDDKIRIANLMMRDDLKKEFYSAINEVMSEHRDMMKEHRSEMLQMRREIMEKIKEIR
jgi:hypothetical protein